MIRRALLALSLAPVLAAFGGCAAGGGGSDSSRSPDLLTLEDMAPYSAQDLYQVVRRLRSTWLNSRGAQGTPVLIADPEAQGVMRASDEGEGQIQVYINGTRAMNGIDALRELSVEEVQEVRHLNSRDATMQFGTDHGSGAILVTTRRG